MWIARHSIQRCSREQECYVGRHSSGSDQKCKEARNGPACIQVQRQMKAWTKRKLAVFAQERREVGNHGTTGKGRDWWQSLGECYRHTLPKLSGTGGGVVE